MAETVSRFLDYDLPPGRIADRPVEPRDAARLLVVRKGTGALEDRVFRDLPDLLDPGDLLVVNDTRVIPARLHGRRVDTGGAVEVFLLRDLGDARWRVLLGPARRMRPGVRIALAERAAGITSPSIPSAGTSSAGPTCVVESVEESGERVVRFEDAADATGTSSPRAAADVLALAERVGETPLPPYVRRDADARDRADYQTVYAREPGAVAAPTAGLHFTDALLRRLADRGVGRASVTLHVGPGTFRPISAEDPADHRMDAEAYVVPADTAAAIATTRASGRRVVAVGTTVVRTLEAAAGDDGAVSAGAGETSLFIRPGHAFRALVGRAALVTNFHLPRTTLLLLVAAFVGDAATRAAYQHAIEAGYRFYSYGDAMIAL